MRGVVVTLLRQPDPARDRHAVYRRLGMFLHGIKEVCDEIEIVHFARAQEMTSLALASDAASDYWGLPVKVRLVPANERARGWWQTSSLPFSLRYRGDFLPYLGSIQAAALSRILDDGPTLIFAQQLHAMVALLQLPPTAAPVFFDLDDLQHRVKSRAAKIATSQVAKMRNSLEVPALLAAERRGLERAMRTFVCSPLDRTILADLHFDVSRTAVIPNAAEIPMDRPKLSTRQTILLIGNYGYPPNAEAAERLITRIWPKLDSAAEAPTLIIAGDHPDRIPAFHHHPPGVEFTGFVTDLDDLYARTRIVCCPISNGGGTRLKLIEAAGYGKPIVATAVAVEGLEFSPSRDVWINDDDNELAAGCARLLHDDHLADALAASAFQKARSLYALANIPGQIAQELRAGLDCPAVVRSSSRGERGALVRDQLGRLIQLLTAPVTRRENR